MSIDPSKIKNSRVLIKTFMFESGVWYLSQSFVRLLKENNNEVRFIPKARYTLDGGFYKRSYPKQKSPEEFPNKNLVYPFALNIPVDRQVSSAIDKFKPNYVISFETLMETAQWVSRSKAKHKDLKVIDVPMSEWVQKKFLDNKSYQVFDSIWALTDLAGEIFTNSGYENVIRTEWEFADQDLFYPAGKDTQGAVFLHLGSLNSGKSFKNTDLVAEAYMDAKLVDSKLLITGKFGSNRIKQRVEKHGNIEILDGPLSREDIAELYRKSDCVIAPSVKEGLGLSFYEAKSSGCKIITTDAPPMNQHTKYLCNPISLRYDDGLVPRAIIDTEQIKKQINRVYEDIMSDKTTVTEKSPKENFKTPEEVAEENESFLAAMEGVSEEEPKETKSAVNPDVLAKLKEKSNKMKVETVVEEEVVQDLMTTQEVSINLAVLGVGQAGSRIAEEFHKLGYDAGVINTSMQDLKYIDVMDNQKLYLEGSLGGTGKDLDLGREIFASNRDIVNDFVMKVVDGNDMAILCLGSGGGTGASSVDEMIPLLHETGMPVGVIFILPKQTEDAQSKRNSIETLARLAKMTKEDMISSLVVVDNARIEQIYGGLSQAQFWHTANKAIVEPMHLFNHLTSQASQFTSLDPSDFGKVVSCGDCSVYGVVEVENYMEETSLAEAIIESLNSNMLAEGFDLSQTRAGGVMIVGSEKALNELPAINIDYAFHMVSDQTNGASIYQGIYALEDADFDGVKIYSWFAGLGLPQNRVDNLRKESQEQAAVAAEKARGRGSAMTLELEDNQVKSHADEIHRKIQKKKSGFNKLQGGARKSIIDKRRKR